MSYKNIDIQNILSKKEVHWKLIFCPKRRNTYDDYRISIELENKKRQYTCVSFEELFNLIHTIPIEKRCFYEHISCGDVVKFYLDYEYYKSKQNLIIDLNKALLSIQKLFINVIRILLNDKNISIDDMIVLESSSSEKESYHIIFDNKNIRFSDNHSIYLFIQEVFRIILLVAINHECLRSENCIRKKYNNEATLSDIINVFNIVRLEWFGCINCKIQNTELTVSDVCNLFVYDNKGCLISCVDFKVYGMEQDFRMFMCTKNGEERPLKNSIIFKKESKAGIIPVCRNDDELNIVLMKNILQRSLITECRENDIRYVEINGIWKWAKLIRFNFEKKREESVENKLNIKKKHLSVNEYNRITITEHEISAEIWTKSYLKSIGSLGIIHSIRTGKHPKFIMCNIRNMDFCKELHEDYFNDSTVYINLDEKKFCVRCNRIPCNKKSWMWQLMI